MECERIGDETLSDLVRAPGLREPLLVGLGQGSRDARGGTVGLHPCIPKPHYFGDPLEAVRQTTSALAVLSCCSLGPAQRDVLRDFEFAVA